MSGVREALFQAVLDNPSDDAPRFAYAGYCDAQGAPYGAFIRAQLARTQELRHGYRQDAWRYDDEARKIEREHRAPSWTHGIEKLAEHPEFIRGFVEKVSIDAERYLAHADELYQRAPIRHLALREVGDHIATIARDPHLAQLVSLVISNSSRARPIGDAGLVSLLSSPHLRNLKVLEIQSQGISMAGLEALCASKALPSLVYVNLHGNQFEDPTEDYAQDWAGGIVGETISLRPLGRQLEQKYGDIPWLHWPSRLGPFPPSADEL